MRSTWCLKDAYSPKDNRDASHDSKDHVVLLVNQDDDSVALQLLVHVVDVHNDNYDEDDADYAES